MQAQVEITLAPQCNLIPGSTTSSSSLSSTYTVQSSDGGLYIQAEATVSNSNGTRYVFSAPEQTMIPQPPVLSSLSFSTPTPYASTSIIASVNGSNFNYGATTYQWYVCTAAVTSNYSAPNGNAPAGCSTATGSGSTGSSYTPATGDVGKYLAVVVSVTNYTNTITAYGYNGMSNAVAAQNGGGGGGGGGCSSVGSGPFAVTCATVTITHNLSNVEVLTLTGASLGFSGLQSVTPTGVQVQWYTCSTPQVPNYLNPSAPSGCTSDGPAQTITIQTPGSYTVQNSDTGNYVVGYITATGTNLSSQTVTATALTSGMHITAPSLCSISPSGSPAISCAAVTTSTVQGHEYVNFTTAGDIGFTGLMTWTPNMGAAAIQATFYTCSAPVVANYANPVGAPSGCTQDGASQNVGNTPLVTYQVSNVDMGQYIIAFITVDGTNSSTTQPENFTAYTASVAISNGQSQSTVVTDTAIPGLTVPATGATPVTSITDAQFTGTVTWSPAASTFAASTAYTATVTLTAASGYTLSGFAGTFTVAGANSVTYNNGVLTVVFPATLAAQQQNSPTIVTDSAIPGLTIPATGATPVTSITDAQFTGTVTWSPADATFAASTGYTATVTLTPASGYTLSGFAGTFTVAGATSVANNHNTVLTVVFPATHAAQQNPTMVSDTTLTGLTVPATGGTPVTSLTDAQYSATVTWSNSPVLFAASTGYTATVTLTAASDYTLSGLTAVSFAVPGSSSLTYNNGVLTVVFPATQAAQQNSPTAVTDTVIHGLTVPVTGATPVTSITPDSQYTGTVTWSTSPATFAADTSYTATVTLTPASGYVFSGPSTLFSVAGAVSTTRSGNTLTVVFPVTALPVVPVTPAPVTNVQASISSLGVASITWSWPVTPGSSKITGYTVTASPGGLSCDTPMGTGCSIVNLTSGTYTFTVVAHNAAGASFSATSAPVTYTAPAPQTSTTPTTPATPTTPTTPSTPLVTPKVPGKVSFTASALGSGSVKLTIIKAPAGSKPTTEYRYRVGNGKWISMGAAKSVIITGLKRGLTSIQVEAINSVGTSAAAVSPVVVR